MNDTTAPTFTHFNHTHYTLLPLLIKQQRDRVTYFLTLPHNDNSINPNNPNNVIYVHVDTGHVVVKDRATHVTLAVIPTDIGMVV